MRLKMFGHPCLLSQKMTIFYLHETCQHCRFMRACEYHILRQYQAEDSQMTYPLAFWLISITFLTVGYGDVVPHSYCGRGVSITTGLLGTCATALTVAIITKYVFVYVYVYIVVCQAYPVLVKL